MHACVTCTHGMHSKYACMYGMHVCMSHQDVCHVSFNCIFVTFSGTRPCVCPIRYVFWSVSVSLCVSPAFEHCLLLWKALYQPARSAETLCSTQKISDSFVSNISLLIYNWCGNLNDFSCENLQFYRAESQVYVLPGCCVVHVSLKLDWANSAWLIISINAYI